VGFEPTVSSS